ncbi:Transcriptional regulatory protein TyrR [Marinomonas aquimarina]|uniref:Transcriptional regulatory protein TyrR n=1 Tax=Marinomonas aquimarina TaxID=295068 RepID=A0A1A8TCY8_9GAMM|nr:TyrR/PhhR family helix-turn-helix DNA-binding protein [Marinomonas aquimarina]SBS30170.1 Transcriptional regulatory protein TyrR [Marinomonas aquimarina]
MRLEVRCEDRVGMAREILDLLVPYHIDMRRIEVDSRAGCLYVGFEDLAFNDLKLLLADIRRLRGVTDVKTVHYTPSEREQHALHTLLEALPDGVVAVDLKGCVTMATHQAAQDLGVALEDLIGHSLSEFIASIAFERLDWPALGSGVTKRVRLNGQLLLLEMQPFFVSNENALQVCAGGVVHIRSAQRLGRQASSLRKAPDAEHALQGFLKPSLTKSAVMKRCLAFAKAYVANDSPMLLTGEFAVGKKRLLEAIFQYWQQQHLEHDAVLRFVPAATLTPQTLPAHLQQGGWLALLDVELLSDECQQLLIDWLKEQPSRLFQIEAPSRVIGVSRLADEALRQQDCLRDELYFLLSAFQLVVPPLRDRKEDLLGLCTDILEEACERFNDAASVLSKDALATLKMHHWPGNLKELESCLYQARQVASQGDIEAQDLPIQVGQTMPIELIDGSLDKTVKAYEAEVLRKLYPQYPSTRKLAKFLNVSHSSIANKLKDYGIV